MPTLNLLVRKVKAKLLVPVCRLDQKFSTAVGITITGELNKNTAGPTLLQGARVSVLSFRYSR